MLIWNSSNPVIRWRGAVDDAIHDLVGTSEGGREIRMGADGTPTKSIDQVAEDCIVA